ncbi:carbohydrate kinase family protein [Planctomycetales bacterium ZRK34]|nr:carbohydrate kinase family protein [Planctomycetales bacterium ZRK34]
MKKRYDCVVCGSCVVDILVRPVPLDEPIGGGKLVRTEPIELTTGGIVSNAGVAMARLGMNIAAFTWTGDDIWAPIIRDKFAAEGLDTSAMSARAGLATSTTAVLIDAAGERSFMHCVGATKQMDRAAYLDKLDLFAQSRMMLLGYYPLMPNLLNDLPQVLAAIRDTGCMTALDAAGDGGDMQPLDQILPHLDIYVPSHNEAEHQTGESDPQRIINRYREAGAPGLLGVKLGADGALLSPAANQFIEIAAVTPPGPVIDTTGAGDCFYGGLLTGLMRNMPLHDAGRLAAATGACCVTGLGATAGLRDLPATCHLAGLP